MQRVELVPIGTWSPDGVPPAFTGEALLAFLPRVREPLHVVRETGGRVGAALAGRPEPARAGNGHGRYSLLATLPALYPEWLGDRSFLEVHRLRFPYATGAMASGIASTRMVMEVARAGMLGIFGAGGLALEQVEAALVELRGALGEAPWATNLIHSPLDPALEEAVVDLYLRHDVRRASASAYMSLTPPLVRFAASGLSVDPAGQVLRRRYLLAKVSRPEVARLFLSPPPPAMLDALVAAGRLRAEEAALARRVPLCEDLTVEADSGGHTDNRPLPVLLPALLQLRDELVVQHGYRRPIRVGAAGGLGTPAALAAAFAMGAAYVKTGSVNQAAVESGLSDEGKRLLARADVADVTMAPSPDMFELGVKVQVLKRGTLFAARAARLYELYTRHAGLEELPAADRTWLEEEVLRARVEQIWGETRAYFAARRPAEVARAEREPKHRMALVFRWYLGNASRWAISGDPARRLDYQIWCGPAMGGFNAWTAGSFLGEPRQRGVVQIGLNLLEGAAVITRAQQLRSYGVAVPLEAFQFRPRPLSV
jgi:trans-AT polyketide synthase, acyltransferase and oxidoreductase domains